MSRLCLCLRSTQFFYRCENIVPRKRDSKNPLQTFCKNESHYIIRIVDVVSEISKVGSLEGFPSLLARGGMTQSPTLAIPMVSDHEHLIVIPPGK